MPRKKPPVIRKHFSSESFYAFLVKYVHKKFPAWSKKYAHVVGIDVGKKIKNDERTIRYSIIFHVIEKTDQVPIRKLIPPTLLISFKGRKKKVITDVVKTGASTLQYIHPGQNSFQLDDVDHLGTLGMVVFKNAEPHLLSNMHVLGRSYLRTVQSIFDKPFSIRNPEDITCLHQGVKRPLGYFRSGVVNSAIDAAIAFIPPRLQQYINPFQQLFTLDNPIVLPAQPISQPFRVRMLGNISSFQDSWVVSSVAARIFPYSFGDLTLMNLIALKPCCSVPGDSGSAVYEPISKRILGIVLGRDMDRKFTFVIPYYKIQQTFSLD